MPITIQNSAGGGVTLDSTTSSNETLQLPSGGGTLAPLASPSFTGNVGVSSSSYPILQATATTTNNASLRLKGSLSSAHYWDIQHVHGDNDLTFGWSGDERMRIDADGDVLVGKTTTALATAGLTFGSTGFASITRDGYESLSLNRLTSGGSVAVFYKDGTAVGSIGVNPSATSFNTSSDYRLKTNVTPMVNATAAVKLLKPCNFDWIADGSNVNGFLAHELAEVVPESVTGTKDAMMDEEYEVTPATDTEAAVMGTRSVPDMQGIDQAKLVPLLTATIQELIARIEALENV